MIIVSVFLMLKVFFVRRGIDEIASRRKNHLERTFTKEDVVLFTKYLKDEGVHHVTPDEQRRFVVQGLLTSTLPTKIGGDYNVLARKMDFEFLRPVFSGDTIRCDVTIEQFELDEKHRTKIIADIYM